MNKAVTGQSFDENKQKTGKRKRKKKTKKRCGEICEVCAETSLLWFISGQA